MKQEQYQWALIGFSSVVVVALSIFVYRELFPEYKLYQNRYIELEQWKAKQTQQPVAPFKSGIKQVVMQKTPTGPVEIDRCNSCHVAMDLPHFMPMRVSTDINGEVRRDARGRPLLEPNPDFIWRQVDEKVAQLEKGSDHDKSEAAQMKAWSSVEVGGHRHDMKAALQAHPLLSGETRPFEFHPVEEFGCTVCHSGNGRALTSTRAHGPVFDGEYPQEHKGPEPVFQEKEENPPEFSKVFNHKPGSTLLFQTTPVLAGSLVQARCADCHQSDQAKLNALDSEKERITEKQRKREDVLKESVEQDRLALIALGELWVNIRTIGFEKTFSSLQTLASRWDQTPDQRAKLQARVARLELWRSQSLSFKGPVDQFMQSKIAEEIEAIVGEKAQANLLLQMFDRDSRSSEEVVDRFLERNQEMAPLSFLSASLLEKNKRLKEKEGKSKDLDPMSENLASWEMGQNLFLSQGCYACHKIERLSRGAVGPELTRIGLSYPWYIKESIVWPQADLVSSTMPNFKLDHEDLEDLMTFLLSQRGSNHFVSEVDHKLSTREWESGAKLPWERAVTQITDLEAGAEIFATEGCASCHRLKGFRGQWGFSNEKLKTSLATQDQSDFFERLFPEQINGHELVQAIASNRAWIDQNLQKVRPVEVLDRINQKYPGLLLSYHTPFKVANRLMKESSKDPADLERLQKVFWVYLQTWGLGREIGPHLHWSGVHRSKQWLMEHFKNPQASVARSIMPAFPFDVTKFEMLTHMLQVMGRENRDKLTKLWQERGFDPEKAYDIYCSQCHGKGLLGDGVISQWIYPIPKNLRQATFLRHLTKERAIESIKNGVPGGPMPGWALHEEAQSPVLSDEEIGKIVDWLFTNLPGSELVPSSGDVPKWNWTPEQIEKEILEDPDYKVKKSSESSKGFRPPVASIFEAQQESPASEIFDVTPASSSEGQGSEKWKFYIKENFYTQANIDAAWPVFMEHCAHCHGAKAGGDGLRAVTMREAKPRMLTNVKWISHHDDVRLLRSIKFGVPGTAMTSFADVTTPLQRLQLVVLIRSLSIESNMRESLEKTLTKQLSLLELDESQRARTQTLYDAWMKFAQRLIGNADTRLFYQQLIEAYQLMSSLSQPISQAREEAFAKLKLSIDQALQKTAEEKVSLSGQLQGAAQRQQVHSVGQKLEVLETLKAQLEQTLAIDHSIRQNSSSQQMK